MSFIFNELKERKIMTHLDELVSFILSDELKEVRNYNCYDKLVSEAKRLQQKQVKNIAGIQILNEAIGSEENSCDGCKYSLEIHIEDPCCECCRNHSDRYKQE
jgi:hypothetical protein